MGLHGLKIDGAIYIGDIPILRNDTIPIDGERCRIRTAVLTMDKQVQDHFTKNLIT
jgi:hypothetical protein